jgi:hypothetical protein
MFSFSCSQCARSWLCCSLRSASSFSSLASRSCDAFVGFLAQRLALDLELHDAPLHFVELRGHRVDLHPQRDAASSTRSMALSGRKRSVM